MKRNQVALSNGIGWRNGPEYATDEDAILISHEREKVKGSGEIGLTRKLTNVGESILFLTNQPFPLEIIRIFFCYNKDLRGNKS